jgi:hypothetical protein
MPERIREPSLAMGSPRDLMIGERLYVGSAGVGGSIDEAAGFIDEDLDPRGGQPNIGRARLARLAWYGLVDKEWSAVQIKAGNSAQVPEFAGAERGPVPADRRGGVGDDQHHRQNRAVGFAGHGPSLVRRVSAALEGLMRRGRVRLAVYCPW